MSRRQPVATSNAARFAATILRIFSRITYHSSRRVSIQFSVFSFQCYRIRHHCYGLLVTRYVSVLHLADLDGLEALEKSARPFRVELRVTCFDAKKKTVDRSALE